MGNTTSLAKRSISSSNSVTVDLFSSDTTNQLIQLHASSQNITDILTCHEDQLLEEHRLYNSLVDQDTITSRVWAAQCKIYGFGTQKNVSEGFHELLKLKQFKEAFYPIACYYYERKKYDYAYHYFYKLRKSNHFAQYRLALMLFRGQGTLINHEKAFRYMKLSASNNNKYAQFILGFYYEYGVLVKQSISTAKLWYQRSANQGFSDAQLAMANLLLIDINKILEDKSSSTKCKALTNQAIDWLYKAVDQENASAYIRLGALHEEGTILPKDINKAIECYEKAIKSPLALPSIKALGHYFIGINYRIGGPDRPANEKLAFQHLTASSNAGYAPAQRALGLMYAKGIGTIKNDAKAKKLFQKAASQGDIRSMGLAADHDYDCHNKITSAIRLYEKAAKLGSLTAQLSLAELFQRTGQLDKAFQWFDRASRNTPGQERISILDFNVGFVSQRNTAQLMVARYRYNGWGVRQDPLLAFQTFKKLSENGFSDAHYWLAACYEEGILKADGSDEWLVHPNLPLAFEIYLQSANSGDIDGQFQVAYMLSNGVGVPKDTVAAFIWYQKAADKGHTIAQYSLGMYYEHGLGVPQDLEKAKEWYQLAAAKGSQLATVKLAKVLVLLGSSSLSLNWLKKAIDMGNVPALREMATLYKNGLIENENGDNYEAAFNYYQMAAEKDDALSWYALSEFYQGYYNSAEEAVVPENPDEAVRCLEKSIELGNTGAIIDLAELYHRQDSTDKAMKIYRDAAESTKMEIVKRARIGAARIVIYENYGDEQDKINVYHWLVEIITSAKDFPSGFSEVFELLGYCSENGIGAMKDKDAAIQFYIDSINENDGTDLEQLAKQRSLCRLIYNCMEQKNYLSAFNYLELLKPGFESLCQLKSADAKKHIRRMKYYFGHLLLHGLGTEKNVPESIYWLSKAAEEGEGDAFYELGCYYSKLNGNLEDIVRDYYEQGVSVGHAGCMRQLALLLLEEETDQAVLDEDYDGGAEIVDLLKSASRCGDTEATYYLGKVHEAGLGDVIPVKEIDKALEYYLEAANSNHELAIMKAGEILSQFSSRHDEAIEQFRKADLLYGNIKAKVMLISYSFQGYYNKDESCNADVEQSDVYNFKKLQAVIDKEIYMMKLNGGSLDEAVQTQDSVINKEGVGLAFYLLGQCYELGRGTLVDLDIAKEYYFHAVTMSEHVDAMWRLGVVYKDKEKNDRDALQWFRRAAEKGKHCESQFQLGLFHSNGWGGLEKNLSVAKKYFSKAVEQGHPLAMFELAQIVWNLGDDYFYAYELYKTSGEQFHVSAALRELGHLSHTGFSCGYTVIVQQNYKAAFAYYCQAAQLGDAVSALMIGNYFEEGYLKEDLTQNRERALQWYESAYRLNCGGLSELAIGKLKHTIADTINDIRQAEDIREEAFAWFESAASHLEKQPEAAKIMVALYYLNGWGRKSRDTETGFHMLSEIADSGGNEAYIPVAQCYEEGIGTEYDMSQALKYWSKAADLDSPEALFRVGEIYELGLSGIIDKKLAAVYYQKATLAKSRGVVYRQQVQNHHPVNRDSHYSLDSLVSSLSTSSSSSISLH